MEISARHINRAQIVLIYSSDPDKTGRPHFAKKDKVNRVALGIVGFLIKKHSKGAFNLFLSLGRSGSCFNDGSLSKMEPVHFRGT